jgi:hypothetical protein
MEFWRNVKTPKVEIEVTILKTLDVNFSFTNNCLFVSYAHLAITPSSSYPHVPVIAEADHN